MLQSTKESTLTQLGQVERPSALSGNDFELIVFENSVINAQNTPFEGKLRHTEDREFPDIVAADLFGVEVKATKKDDWTSIGNSVLESSRVNTVEKIYMFFGKLGGTPDIRYRNYEDCLKGIAVTHYPRYQIDMLLADDDSIFKKMGVDYDALRHSGNPVKEIRAYYRSQLREGDALWWIDDDIDKTAQLSPIIKNFASLDQDTRDLIKADIFVLFPELFSNGAKKYERIPAYLAAQYGVVTANLRDHFTAGGQMTIKYQDQDLRVPQMMGELCRLASLVRSELEKADKGVLANYWRKHIDDADSPEIAWKKELDHNSAVLGMSMPASELFTAFIEERGRP